MVIAFVKQSAGLTSVSCLTRAFKTAALLFLLPLLLLVGCSDGGRLEASDISLHSNSETKHLPISRNADFVEVDLGNVLRLDDNEIFVNITNTHRRSVSLKTIKSSCSCVEISPTNAVIEPNGNLQFRFSLRDLTQLLPGKMNGFVYLEFDPSGDERSKNVVFVKWTGTASDKISLETKLPFSRGIYNLNSEIPESGVDLKFKNELKNKDAQVYFRSKNNILTVSNIVSTSDEFIVTIKQSNTALRTGKFFDVIEATVKDSGREKPVTYVPLSLYVSPKISILPQLLLVKRSSSPVASGYMQNIELASPIATVHTATFKSEHIDADCIVKTAKQTENRVHCNLEIPKSAGVADTGMIEIEFTINGSKYTHGIPVAFVD